MTRSVRRHRTSWRPFLAPDPRFLPVFLIPRLYVPAALRLLVAPLAQALRSVPRLRRSRRWREFLFVFRVSSSPPSSRSLPWLSVCVFVLRFEVLARFLVSVPPPLVPVGFVVVVGVIVLVALAAVAATPLTVSTAPLSTAAASVRPRLRSRPYRPSVTPLMLAKPASPIPREPIAVIVVRLFWSMSLSRSLSVVMDTGSSGER